MTAEELRIKQTSKRIPGPMPACKEPVIAELVRNSQGFPHPVFVCAKHAGDSGVNGWFGYPHWQLLLPFETPDCGQRAGKRLAQSHASPVAERALVTEYVDARIRQLSERVSPLMQNVLRVVHDYLAG